MSVLPLPPVAARRTVLASLSAHLLVALIALVGVGGATRVMEAGLACPDWPLCYGALLPGRQMNLQVFLEWFHRLDAFFVALGLLALAATSFLWRRDLPRAVPALAAASLVMVVVQAALGALTVTLLLPFAVVTAHLITALLLVALVSICTQLLLGPPAASRRPGRWWTGVLALLLAMAFVQSLLGGLMASQWAAGRCLSEGEACRWLLAHRLGARPLATAVLALAPFVAWRWPSGRLLAVFSALAVLVQVALGVFSLRLSLSVPMVTVAHQVGAALLVALLAALLSRSLFSPCPQELGHG